MEFNRFQDVTAYQEDGFYRQGQSYPAFWTVVNNKEFGGPRERAQAILKHTNLILAMLLEWREPITRVQRMNVQLYKGRHFFSQEQFSNLPYNRNRRYDQRQAKIVMPYLTQAADQHVADMTAYEPTLTVMPLKDEESSRINARMNRQILHYYENLFNLKSEFQGFHRRKKVQGESFMFCTWDEDLGDYTPKYKELRRIRQEMGQDPDAPIPLLDPETGSPIMGEQGLPLFITQSQRQGDLRITHEYSERVLYPSPESYRFEDCPYIFWLKWMDVDELKARNPAHADQIKPDGMYRRYMGQAPKSLTQKVCVRCMYHPRSRFLPEGFYSETTETAMLEMGPYPFSHNYFPCIRGTDIDLDFETTGMSFYQYLASINFAINDSTSAILQNQREFAYPKYAAPRGAKVRYNDLGADRGIYEYSGPVGPKIMSQDSTPQDTFKWRQLMQDEFKTFSAIYATSRGEGIDGITANVALRLIDQQERKLHKPAIDKHGFNCKRLGELQLGTLLTYRDPLDGSLLKILGKNEQRYLKFFDSTDSLAEPCEVILVRSSGLPEEPAAKMQTVLDLKETFPDLWDSDEALEMLDIKMPEKLIESATVSRQAAESEVEDILAGMPDVPVPAPYHDIIPRYKVYEKAVQGRAFEDAHPLIKQRMLTQIITAEYVMMKKMMNPAFAERVLVRCPNFPMYMPQPLVGAQPYQLATPPPVMLPGAEGAAPLGGVDPALDAEGPSPAPDQSLPSPETLPSQTVPPPGAAPLP